VKKTAVLIDAGFVRAMLPKKLSIAEVTRVMESLSLACVSPHEGEELHRILYYDCPPYDGLGGHSPHPLDPTRTPTSTAYRHFWNSVHSILRSKPYFCVRLGEVSFEGWGLTSRATSELLAHRRPPVADDFSPVLRQKGIDLQIGLDVALMAKDRLIDRIVVVSADADIAPAMKLARNEGVQVVLAALGHKTKVSLREHADLYRSIDVPTVISALYPDGVTARPSRN
jgi:uncharacterized LabA/DUF88 family protein